MGKMQNKLSISSSSKRLWYWSPISYTAFTLALPYFLFRMISTQKYRAGLRQRLTLFTVNEITSLQERPYIWIHAVSVGELMAAKPLVIKIKQDHPQMNILVSTVTDTGQQLARSMKEIDQAIYLPLDLYPLCRRVLSWVQPLCIVIMETELWPNFIRSATDLEIPLVLVNARLSDKSFKNYVRFKSLFAPLLKRFHHIFTQSKTDSDRFLQITSTGNIQTVGNLKFEAVSVENKASVRDQWRHRFQINNDEILLLGGSTFPGEESILVRVFKLLRDENLPIRLVIAPRHIERIPTLVKELQSTQLPIFRRSQLDESTEMKSNTLLLLDTMGELREVYAAADMVFIGKSLCGQGGQNPIEAAAWGRAVIFGNNMQNFRDVSELFLRNDAACSVSTEAELVEVCRKFCIFPEKRVQMGKRAIQVIQENQGTLDAIVEIIQPFLQESNQAT